MPTHTHIKFEDFQKKIAFIFNWLNIHGNGEFVNAECRDMNNLQSSCFIQTKSFPECEIKIWRQGDKCEVSMTLPRAKDGEIHSVWVNNEQQTAPSIGFSFNIDEEKIAKSILKRFVPEYKAFAALHMERVAQINSALDKHDTFIREICAVIGAKPENGANGSLRMSYPLFRRTRTFEIGYGDVRIEQSDVYFDRFRLSPSAAVRVLKLLMEIENEKLSAAGNPS